MSLQITTRNNLLVPVRWVSITPAKYQPLYTATNHRIQWRHKKGIKLSWHQIYNKTGKYIDSFYLGLPLPRDEAFLFFQKEACIDKETLLIREQDSEGNYVVTKYKVHGLKGTY